ARLTARGSFARRQKGLVVVIDATPCAFIVMAGGKSKNDSAVESKTDWQHSSGSLNGSNTKCNSALAHSLCRLYPAGVDA
ncbi:hypothetical protein, partial [Pseudomonas viridiflava]|uniref:hypothetical protein n=1 Tax=Pseudomonas viridiflava TaxID=33069 RepID=UPI00197EF4ED